MQSGIVSETRVRVMKAKAPRQRSEQSESPKTYSLTNGGLPEQNFRSLAERVAGHRLYQKGIFLQFLKDAFPSEKHMWCVDRYFPYSIHGPLYVDEPVKDFQVLECERKKAVLAKHGLRLVILGPMATAQQAMEQISEFAPWPGQSAQR